MKSFDQNALNIMLIIFMGQCAKMIFNFASKSVSNTKVSWGAKRVPTWGSCANIVFSLKRSKI